MIAYLEGEILFSDGNEVIIRTDSGVAYQIYCRHVLAEGDRRGLYISHVIRENGQELFSFRSLREKKLFEMLMTVKGVGPKSAYSLMSSLAVNDIHDAVMFENKKLLQQAQGVGPKAAAQIMLDLKSKIGRVKMYGELYSVKGLPSSGGNQNDGTEKDRIDHKDENHTVTASIEPDRHSIMRETVMACKELGFRESDILPLAQKILSEGTVTRSEQLVHLVLKGI
jgi:Holliday junction DNA helicase RuvA